MELPLKMAEMEAILYFSGESLCMILTFFGDTFQFNGVSKYEKLAK